MTHSQGDTKFVLQQNVQVNMPVRGFHVVEQRRWRRIERRIVDDLGRTSFDWAAAGWAFFGLAAAAGVALLVLPHATTKSTHLSSSVHPALWGAVIGGVVLWGAFLAFSHSDSADRCRTAHDVRNELRTARGAGELPPPAPMPKKIIRRIKKDKSEMSTDRDTAEWDVPDVT